MPTLYDVIDSPSQLYLVMEYVVGQNLSSYLKQGSLVVIQEKTVDNHQQKMQKSKCM